MHIGFPLMESFAGSENHRGFSAFLSSTCWTLCLELLLHFLNGIHVPVKTKWASSPQKAAPRPLPHPALMPAGPPPCALIALVFLFLMNTLIWCQLTFLPLECDLLECGNHILVIDEVSILSIILQFLIVFYLIFKTILRRMGVSLTHEESETQRE